MLERIAPTWHARARRSAGCGRRSCPSGSHAGADRSRTGAAGCRAWPRRARRRTRSGPGPARPDRAGCASARGSTRRSRRPPDPWAPRGAPDLAASTASIESVRMVLTQVNADSSQFGPLHQSDVGPQLAGADGRGISSRPASDDDDIMHALPPCGFPGPMRSGDRKRAPLHPSRLCGCSSPYLILFTKREASTPSTAR